jgi:hypothetical protein
MSAYNFFFRDQRNKILETTGGVPDEETKKSFEDIGRVIGQRWREIEPDELAKYQELAKEDAERYKVEMKVFYEEELAMMCSGNAKVASFAEDDKKPAAGQQLADQTQLMQLMQQGVSPSSIAPAAPVGAMAAVVHANTNQTAPNVMNVEQLGQLQNMLQNGNGTSPPGNFNKQDLLQEIISQRSAIQQRLVALLQESEMLRVKDRLLEQLLSSLTGVPGTGTNSSTSGVSGLNQTTQESFLQNGQLSSPPVFNNNFGNNAGLAQATMPSFGQFANQQQGMAADNTALLNQLMASQLQQQQFSTNTATPAAAATPSANQDTTTSEENSDQAAAANQNTSTPQPPTNMQALLAQNGTGGMNQAQSLTQNEAGGVNQAQALPQNGAGGMNQAQSLAQNGTGGMNQAQSLAQNGTGGMNQAQSSAQNGIGGINPAQFAAAFGFTGAPFNTNNSTQPPPDVAALIAQIMSSQQNQSKPQGN